MTKKQLPAPAPEQDDPTTVYPMTPIVLAAKLLMIGGLGYIWANWNILHGNAVAMEDLNLFPGADLTGRCILAALPSVFQLALTEDFKWGFLKHPSVGAFAVIVGLVDTLGPAYAWLLLGDRAWSLENMGLALLWGICVSILAQHGAWVSLKDVVGWGWHHVRGGWSAFRQLFTTRRVQVEELQLAPGQPLGPRRTDPTTDG